MPRNMENHREWWRKRRLEFRRVIEEAKDVPCADCNIKYPVFVMTFDHVKGEKKFNLGEATAKCKSMKALLEEVEKCVVVCQNCHTLRTFRARGYKI